MKLVVISPEHDHPRETALVEAMFAAGLERYHVRKPHASAQQLEAWLCSMGAEWRSRIILHQHHPLVGALGLGGRHWRDDGSAPTAPARDGGMTSGSCHDLVSLRRAMGKYDSVFFGPVFSSVSKAGYGPRSDFSLEKISAQLNARTPSDRQTTVLALGGIAAENIRLAREVGFDGVAVLGAIWLAADPIHAFRELQLKCRDASPAGCVAVA